MSRSTYISPSLPAQIRGLYEADLLPASIQMMLNLAADLVQELIDLKATPLDAAASVQGSAKLPQNSLDPATVAAVVGSLDWGYQVEGPSVSEIASAICAAYERGELS